MGENDRKRVLDMLAKGKISVDEAERLLKAMGASPAGDEAPPGAAAPRPVAVSKARPRFLRVVVNEVGGEHAKVNIRVPLELLRSGIKLNSLMPDHARKTLDAKLGQKGIHLDLNDLDKKGLDEFISALTEMSVDVDADDAKVRVFCE